MLPGLLYYPYSWFIYAISPFVTRLESNSSIVDASEVDREIQKALFSIGIIVYQYICNPSNNFSSCCEASDIYREKYYQFRGL